jgi:hypothetical protein
MNKDELIRVLASTRTNLNAKILILAGMQTAFDGVAEPTPYVEVATAQLKLRMAVESLNEAIDMLNANRHGA